MFFLSIFLQQAQSRSPAAAGMRLAPQFVMTALTSLLFSRFLQRFELQVLMTGGYFLMGSGMVLMAGFQPQTSAPTEIACLLLLGFGMGLAVPATRMAVMNAAPPEQACIASVTMNALRQTGTSMGLALMGRLMIRQTIRRMRQALQQAGLVATGYRAAMASGFALAMATTGLVSLAVAATL